MDSHTIKCRFPRFATFCLGIACLPAWHAAPLRADTAPSETPYAAIEQHALDAPKSAEQSIQSLAAYLTAPAKTESEKARTIFSWIAHNIAYDVKSPSVQRAATSKADDLLKKRSAVCFEYAELFSELGRAAGLEVTEVRGYAKGYGYDVGDTFGGPPNHAWNAVKMDGGWRLLDCTWGGGHINEQNQYVRRYDDHYFATSPSEFVYDHFPLEPSWQLLEKPISKAEYEQLPNVRPPFFRCKLKLGSHSQALIRTRDPLVVTLTSPLDCVILARLYENGQKLPKSYTFAQKESDAYKVYASFPHAGSYALSIYAKLRGSTEDCEWAVDYIVEAESGTEAGYPECFAGFSEHGAHLYAPMSANLQPGTKTTFKLDVPGAKEVAVVIGKEWHDLAADNGCFSGEVPISGDSVQVCARFGETRVFDVLLGYGVK
ncbi:MAG: hypothetical protein NTU88_17550 [Armatimonadetes bacterium]|nr:hypothetical protein [Armatimonadota bacterium]